MPITSTKIREFLTFIEQLTHYESYVPYIKRSNDAKGELNIERAMNDASHWYDVIDTTDVTKTKKIVITDWSIRYRHNYENEYDHNPFPPFFQDIWHLLLSACSHLEVYVWTGQLTKVTDMASLYQAMLTVEVIHPSDLIKQVSHTIGKDELLIVDYYVRKKLCTLFGIYTHPRLIENSVDEKADKLIREIEKLDTKIIDIQFNKFQQIRYKKQHVHLSIDEEGAIDRSNLENTTSLTIDTVMNWEELHELLRSTKKLQHLTMSGKIIAASNANAQAPVKLPLLSHLILENIEISPTQLNLLLSYCPNITNVTIKDALPENLEQLSSICSKVELLTLGNYLTESKAKALLSVFPKLRYLILDYSESYDEALTTYDAYISHPLHFIYTNNIYIKNNPTMTDDQLTTLLNRCPNVSNLTLENCAEITGKFARSVILSNLNSLILLNLKKLNVNSEDLNLLLNPVKQLSFIRIKDCPNITTKTVSNLKICGKSHVNITVSLSAITETEISELIQNARPGTTYCFVVPSQVHYDDAKIKALYNQREDITILINNHFIASRDNNLNGNTMAALGFNHEDDSDSSFKDDDSNETQSSDKAPKKNQSKQASDEDQTNAENFCDASEEDITATSMNIAHEKKSRGKQSIASREYFKGCDQDYYRLTYFDNLLPHQSKDQFTLTKQPQIIEAVDVAQSATDARNAKIITAKCVIDGSRKDWMPLPSLHPSEKLISIKTNGAEIEVGYSHNSHFYYVKPKTQITQRRIELSFTLQLSEKPHKLISHFMKSEINKTTENRQLASILNKVQFNKDGSIVDEIANTSEFLQLKQMHQEDLVNELAYFVQSFTHSMDESQPTSINQCIIQKKADDYQRSKIALLLCKALGLTARMIVNESSFLIEVDIEGSYFHLTLLSLDAILGRKLSLGIDPDTALKPDLSMVQFLDHLVPDDQQIQPSSDSESQPDVNSTTLNNETSTPKTGLEKEGKKESNDEKLPITPENKPEPKGRFARWCQTDLSSLQPEDYMNQLLNDVSSLPPNKRNILLVLDKTEIEKFHAFITRFITEETNENQSFFVPSLEDINEKTGKIASNALKAVDSPIVKFIKLGKIGDILITDWSRYNVSYNSMMDDERRLKQTPIPEGMIILNIMDKESAADMGDDFSSRHRIISHFPPISQLPPMIANTDSPDETHRKITFYNSTWKAALLGRLKIQGNSFTLKKGGLLKAIENGDAGIVLHNAPWHLQEFRFFMAELLIKRSFWFNDTYYQLPDSFTLTQTEKEDPLELAVITKDAPTQETAYVLNEETVSLLFETRSCHDKKIFMNPGLLKANKGEVMTLLVTQNLSQLQWIHILKSAKKHQCRLRLIVNTNIELPRGMDALIIERQESFESEYLIKTNDMEYAEELLFKEKPNAHIYSINKETQWSDLIESTKHVKNEKDEFSFDHQLCEIASQLLLGEDVILKGSLSGKLAKQLETLFLPTPYLVINGEIKFPTGKLYIITDSTPEMNLIQPTEKLFYIEDYFNQLTDDLNKNTNFLERECNKIYFQEFRELYHKMTRTADIEFNYGQLRDMFNRYKDGREAREANPFSPYFRLQPGTEAHRAGKSIGGRKKPIKKQKPLDEKRHDKIRHELNRSPYLFIAGSSGIGKSTYILNQLHTEDTIVHVGFDQLLPWLAPDDNKEHVLFIDEANIEKEGSWDIFEGLFNKTPGILWKGTFYPITQNHKVIFAGNFSHYAGREQHAFFARHGQVFTFKPLSKHYLREKVINPSLTKIIPTLSIDCRKNLRECLLKHYIKLANAYPDKVTTRNLKNICMRIGLYFNRDTQFDTHIIKHLNRAIKDEFGDLTVILDNFDVDPKIDQPEFPERLGAFLLTPTRHHLYRIMDEHFAMREMKLSSPELTRFDIPGVLVEGPAGIGKSLLSIEYLKMQGYQQASLTDTKTGKIYYHITPTDPVIMEKTLIKAFHEGAIVIIDELNSLPLERVMNQLLSGVDLNGKPANKAGFFVIATQNPVSYSGRQVLSSALVNRFAMIKLDDYPENELRHIAKNICPDESTANKLVDEYSRDKDHAITHHLIPVPTTRDLFAELSLEAKKFGIDNSPTKSENVLAPIPEAQPQPMQAPNSLEARQPTLPTGAQPKLFEVNVRKPVNITATAEQVIHAQILKGINAYLAACDEKSLRNKAAGLFSYGGTGKKRANAYKSLLSDNTLDADAKRLVIDALLNAEAGKTLQAHVGFELSKAIAVNEFNSHNREKIKTAVGSLNSASDCHCIINAYIQQHIVYAINTGKQPVVTNLNKTISRINYINHTLNDFNVKCQNLHLSEAWQRLDKHVIELACVDIDKAHEICVFLNAHVGQSNIKKTIANIEKNSILNRHRNFHSLPNVLRAETNSVQFLRRFIKAYEESSQLNFINTKKYNY